MYISGSCFLLNENFGSATAGKVVRKEDLEEEHTGKPILLIQRWNITIEP